MIDVAVITQIYAGGCALAGKPIPRYPDLYDSNLFLWKSLDSYVYRNVGQPSKQLGLLCYSSPTW